MTNPPLDHAALRKLAEEATQGEWQVYDSNSWRRIGLKGGYRIIIEPITQRDGHPDLHARREDLDYAAAASPSAVLALLDEVEEFQRTFDLRWDADMRAIKRWREAGEGRELTMPDHADLCVWLLDGNGATNMSNTLPPCMMPDGGDCCPEFHALKMENARLTARVAELEGALKRISGLNPRNGDTLSNAISIAALTQKEPARE